MYGSDSINNNLKCQLCHKRQLEVDDNDDSDDDDGDDSEDDDDDDSDDDSDDDDEDDDDDDDDDDDHHHHHHGDMCEHWGHCCAQKDTYQGRCLSILGDNFDSLDSYLVLETSIPFPIYPSS